MRTFPVWQSGIFDVIKVGFLLINSILGWTYFTCWLLLLNIGCLLIFNIHGFLILQISNVWRFDFQYSLQLFDGSIKLLQGWNSGRSSLVHLSACHTVLMYAVPPCYQVNNIVLLPTVNCAYYVIQWRIIGDCDLTAYNTGLHRGQLCLACPRPCGVGRTAWSSLAAGWLSEWIVYGTASIAFHPSCSHTNFVTKSRSSLTDMVLLRVAYSGVRNHWQSWSRYNTRFIPWPLCTAYNMELRNSEFRSLRYKALWS